MGQGMKRIKEIRTGRFVAINANGDLYSTVRCHFKESYLSSLCFSFLLCKGSQYKQENILIFESLPSSFHARSDRVTFVTATIIYSSSPPLLLAPRVWEPRDQPHPGLFLESRERTVGTRAGLDVSRSTVCFPSTYRIVITTSDQVMSTRSSVSLKLVLIQGLSVTFSMLLTSFQEH